MLFYWVEGGSVTSGNKTPGVGGLMITGTKRYRLSQAIINKTTVLKNTEDLISCQNPRIPKSSASLEQVGKVVLIVTISTSYSTRR